MTSKKQQRIVAFWGVLMLLLVVIMSLERMQAIEFELTGSLRLIELLYLPQFTTAFLCVFVLGLILFFVLVPRSFLKYLIPGAILAILAIFLLVQGLQWVAEQMTIEAMPTLPGVSGTRPQQDEVEEDLGLQVDSEPALQELAPAVPPLERLFMIILLLAGGIALLLVVGQWWYLRAAASPPLPELADQLEDALASLHEGGTWEDLVIRCYAEMDRVLYEAHGVARPQHSTPHEFTSQLVKLGLPRDPVLSLTRLFEQVRYGHVTINATQQSEALASLEAIVQAARGTYQPQPATEQPAIAT